MKQTEKPVKQKMKNVTFKSLKAWIIHTEMIMADEKLVNIKERSQLKELKDTVKEKFVNSKL